MKIMLVGDTHGSIKFVKDKIDTAKAIGGIDRLIILGDFGLWWRFEAIEFIDEINAYAKANNIHIFALPGNHENYEWWESIVENARANNQTSKGFAYLRTHVLLAPRTHRWSWAGKNFAIAGGAVSVDKDWRIKLEQGWDTRYDPPKKCSPKQVYSPREQLTDEEVADLVMESWGKTTDYFLTHDCSDRTPFYGRFKEDFESKIHRQRIDKLLKNLTPKFHFHGHMHTVYDWMNLVGGEQGYTQTYGLECNDDDDSWVILDTEYDAVHWPGAYYHVPNTEGPGFQLRLMDKYNPAKKDENGTV